MTKAKIIGTAPQLLVRNVAETVEFYKQKLGFELIGLVGNPPVYGMIKKDDFQIHFAHSPTGNIRTNRSSCAGCCDFILWIPEIDQFYTELKQREVKIVEEITRRTYGSREFVFQDLDGHHILVGD